MSKRDLYLNDETIIIRAVKESSSIAKPGLSYDEVLNDNFQFDMNAHDVMVFLHIQKTGGTSFGKHLVRDLDLKVSLNEFSVPFEFFLTWVGVGNPLLTT